MSIQEIRNLLAEYATYGKEYGDLERNIVLAHAILDVLRQPKKFGIPKELQEVLTNKALKILEDNPDQSVLKQQEAIQQAQEEIQSQIKVAIRKTDQKISAFGWRTWSSSSGTKYDFDPEELMEMGYGNVEVGGQKLIQTQVVVDQKVYEAAVEAGLIDEHAALELGAVYKTDRTRSTYLKPTND